MRFPSLNAWMMNAWSAEHIGSFWLVFRSTKCSVSYQIFVIFHLLVSYRRKVSSKLIHVLAFCSSRVEIERKHRYDQSDLPKNTVGSKYVSTMETYIHRCEVFEDCKIKSCGETALRVM